MVADLPPERQARPPSAQGTDPRTPHGQTTPSTVRSPAHAPTIRAMLAFMGEPALKIEPQNDDAAERLAMLRSLPVSPEPMTDEERAMFEELEADVREGRRGR
jgi:hypothetical protein